MDELKQKIINRIQRDGPITFEQFMDMALYDMQLGYYASEKTKIGREGDYYTSSHMHPVFGALLGKQFQEMWEFMGRPEDFSVVEPGAGEGHVCRDMLDYMRDTEFFKSLRYIIAEINPVMRKKQTELLGDYRKKVRWCDSLDELNMIRGCIFSNELLDAFPVHIVQMEDELKEVYVSFDGTRLKETLGPLSSQLLSAYFREDSIELQKGYRTEVNLHMREWLNPINKILNQGFVLTIDYGYTAKDYYSEERNRGTLLCYHRHQFSEDPYQNIGTQDITAHINFSSLKRWGEEIGLRTIGFCSQGAFLVSLGIDKEIQRLASRPQNYLFEVAKIKKLILPEGMGESHQVLIQEKGLAPKNLKGFSITNRLRHL